jgi:hypothetical protein
MITDPKTVVRGRVKQVAVVVGVAAAECAIRMLLDFEVIGSHNPLSMAPPLWSLFLVGPPALVWQLWRDPLPAPRT